MAPAAGKEAGSRRHRGAAGRLLMVACLAGFAIAVTAPAGLTAYGHPRLDRVTGTARHHGVDPPFPAIQVHIFAHSDPLGARPGGRMAVRGVGLPEYHGRVTCLSVAGNAATIGMEIMRSTDPSLVGQGQLWSVVDGGTIGPDRIAGYPFTPSPPTVCPPLSFNVPIARGNYVVSDATP